MPLPTAVFLINRLPSLNLDNKSPFELLFQRVPDYKHLKSFGCVCYPLLKPYNSNKLQPKTSKFVFLGYPLDYKGYLCYNMSSGKYIVSRHVVFVKHLFPFLTLLQLLLYPFLCQKLLMSCLFHFSPYQIL